MTIHTAARLVPLSLPLRFFSHQLPNRSFATTVHLLKNPYNPTNPNLDDLLYRVRQDEISQAHTLRLKAEDVVHHINSLNSAARPALSIEDALALRSGKPHFICSDRHLIADLLVKRAQPALDFALELQEHCKDLESEPLPPIWSDEDITRNVTNQDHSKIRTSQMTQTDAIQERINAFNPMILAVERTAHLVKRGNKAAAAALFLQFNATGVIPDVEPTVEKVVGRRRPGGRRRRKEIVPTLSNPASTTSTTPNPSPSSDALEKDEAGVIIADKDTSIRAQDEGQHRLQVRVGNMPFNMGHHELQEFASIAGDVRWSQVGGGGTSRGFGHVEYATEEQAQHAVRTLTGHLIRGRPIHVRAKSTPIRFRLDKLAGKRGEKGQEEGNSPAKDGEVQERKDGAI